MHAFLEVINAILALLSFPFPAARKNGGRRSQLENAQGAVLRIGFGTISFFVAVSWLFDALVGG